MAQKMAVLAETLTGARVLTDAEVKNYGYIVLDPGGAARNVDLPATTNVAGHSVTIINSADAAEALTVRLTSGGATIGTIDQSENATFICYSATAGSWVAQVGKAT